jgi:2-methylisocitrate lyase-like PEP mutase family enzyme
MSLRSRLASPEILVAPGIFDGLSALLVERAGFDAAYVSGASIAYTRFGRPDLGLVSMSEVAETIAAMRERSAIPLIVDADNGYGNALNVQRTVQAFERSGADCIQLEDQSLPKRCGHLDGKNLISKSEMVGKIKAAVDARRNPGTLVMARTDAIAVEGFDAAVDRAEAYRDAGADILFVEAPRGDAEQASIPQRLGRDTPLLANMVEGGKTPVKSAAELQALGYRVVIFPGGIVRGIARFMVEYLDSLKATGSSAAFRDRMYQFNELQALLGTAEILAGAKRYDG